MTDPNEKLMAEKDAIVEAALTHAPFDGWSWKALEAAAVGHVGREPAARRAFPGGLLEAAEHLSNWADRRMTAALQEMDMEPMRLRYRLAAGVRARLELFRLHREAVRRIATFLALPGHKGAVLRLTWNTVDAIWSATGDDSSRNFSYYTKRGLLAPVYVTTVLYWLADDSDGFEDTWDYLDRRIADVLKISTAKARMKESTAKIPSPFRLCRMIREGLNNGMIGP